MPVNFNLLRQAGPANFAEGLMQGQDQQNALLQQQQQRQLSDIQLRNALRGEQEAMAESEAVKGSASLEDLAGRYRKAGLGKQALATEAALAKQRTDKLAAAKSQTELLKTSATRIMSNPDPTATVRELQRYQQLTGVDMSDDIADVQGMTPEKIKQWAAGYSMEADKLLPKFQEFATPAGGKQIGTVNPVTGAFTVAQTLAPEMTPAQIESNRIAQGQLSVAQQRLAWEKDNPSYDLKEDENGNLFGVNKRSLQTVPVMIGAAAPAGGAPVAGGPRVEQPRVAQAIPGMASVLDQAAPAATPSATQPAGPRPFVVKGTAMTEFQSKAAMFGGAMNQANKIISDVEKKGTTTAPVAVSVLQGLARLTPQLLGTGENASSAIEALFRQDPTSLIGPDINQQKLGQAQVAFATAYLRATSGAAFGPSEVANTIKEYFPLIGEDKQVVKQKAEARQRAIEGMKISTTKQGQGYIDKSGANPNDPLGLGIGGR